MNPRFFLNIFFFIVCGSCFAASATSLTVVKDPDVMIATELSRLDTLIQATTESLQGQKKLRERIVEYQKIQELFMKNPNDNDILLRMVKSAYRTLESIKESNLVQTFDPEFIDELTVLSQAAAKRGVPKP
jgi:hypothetical protein